MIGSSKTQVGKQSKICSSFIALLSRMENLVSCTINIDEVLAIDVSVVLSVRVSPEGQNDSSWEESVSLLRSLSKDVFILLDKWRDKISHFVSFGAEQRQVLQVTVVLNVFEIRSLVMTNIPLRLSKTICSTLTVSYWELKPNGTFRISDILRLKAHRKLDGSIGFVALFGWTFLKW